MLAAVAVIAIFVLGFGAILAIFLNVFAVLFQVGLFIVCGVSVAFGRLYYGLKNSIRKQIRVGRN